MVVSKHTSTSRTPGVLLTLLLLDCSSPDTAVQGSHGAANSTANASVTSAGGATTGATTTMSGAGGFAGASTGTEGTTTMGAQTTSGSTTTAGSTGGSTTSGNGGTGGGASVTGGTTGNGGIGGTGGSSGGTGGSGPTMMAPLTTEGFVGNITTRFAVRDDFVDYWDQITPENEGKWGNIERERDVMTWTRMDAVRDYAREHQVPYRGHTLVWGSQQPSWLDGLSETEQREEVEEWIQAFCERYPDVAMIDVVNEPPPHTTPPYLNALGGAGSSGYDWIVQSFMWARQYCPNAVLVLNDYNNIEYQADNDHTIDIVNRIQDAGAPIDAVGCQGHAAFQQNTSTVENFINRIANQTGLPVYITEYDIDVADDNQQRNIMESQFTMFWNNENVVGITIWGYVSGQTWRANTGIMSDSGQQRPAMTWLMEFLGR